MISMRHVYHKKCFTCKECARPMDQFIACDAPDGQFFMSFGMSHSVFQHLSLRTLGRARTLLQY